MSPVQQRIKLAEVCGKHDRWVIMKRGLYYRPHAKGYTSNIAEAWILPEAEADEHTYPYDEPVTKHRAPLPDYLNDRDAMHAAFLALDDVQKVECLGYIYEVARGNHHDKDVALAMATLPQWAQSILRTVGLWEEKPKALV